MKKLTFTYKDTSVGQVTHKEDTRPVVFVIVASNLVEADKAFEKKVGKHPSKMSVTCLINNIKTKMSDETWGGAKVW